MVRWASAVSRSDSRSGDARRGFRAGSRRMRRPTALMSPCCAARYCRYRARPQTIRTASARPSPSLITPTCEVIIARRVLLGGRGHGAVARNHQRGRKVGGRSDLAPRDILRDARGIDHGLEQRVRRQPVGAMRAGGGHFAAGPKPCKRGAAAVVHGDAAHVIMRGRRDRDRLPRRIEAGGHAACIDGREFVGESAHRAPTSRRGTRHGRRRSRRTRRARRCRAARARRAGGAPA